MKHPTWDADDPRWPEYNAMRHRLWVKHQGLHSDIRLKRYTRDKRRTDRFFVGFLVIVITAWAASVAYRVFL